MTCQDRHKVTGVHTLWAAIDGLERRYLFLHVADGAADETERLILESIQLL